MARGDNTTLSRTLGFSPGLINARDENDATPLHIAALKGNMGAVELLMELGSIVRRADKNGWTPLHYAVSVRRARVAVLLLAHGADPNAIDDQGNTPLHFAVANQHFNMVEKLVQFRANPNIANRRGEFPVDWVSPGEFRDRCRALFEASGHTSAAQADALMRQAKGVPHPSEVRALEALVELIRRNDDREFQARLRRDPGLLSVHNNHGATIFHAAAFLGKPEFIKILIGMEADLWDNDNDGWTPLHYALAGNRVKVVSILLAQGADFFAKNKKGLSPAKMARLKSSPGIALLNSDRK